MKYALIAILILVQSASAQIPNPALVKDMASFDQAYIPALAMTAQQQPGPARKAMFLLQMQWEAFDMRYATLVSSDPYWQTGFVKVGAALKTAETHIRSARWQDAHEALEPVGAIFKDLRTRRGIDTQACGLGYDEDGPLGLPCTEPRPALHRAEGRSPGARNEALVHGKALGNVR